jgi:hypothetical protein
MEKADEPPQVGGFCCKVPFFGITQRSVVNPLQVGAMEKADQPPQVGGFWLQGSPFWDHAAQRSESPSSWSHGKSRSTTVGGWLLVARFSLFGITQRSVVNPLQVVAMEKAALLYPPKSN